MHITRHTCNTASQAATFTLHSFQSRTKVMTRQSVVQQALHPDCEPLGDTRLLTATAVMHSQDSSRESDTSLATLHPKPMLWNISQSKPSPRYNLQL